MPKRQTVLQRLVAFAMGATEGELNSAVEMLATIRGERFPRKVKVTSKRKSAPPPPKQTDDNGASDVH